MNFDEVNFVSAKKRTQFRVKSQLGPMICNSREVGQEEDLILQQMKFQNVLCVDMTLKGL